VVCGMYNGRIVWTQRPLSRANQYVYRLASSCPFFFLCWPFQLKFPSPFLIDKEQLKKIIAVLGKPADEDILKIQHEEVCAILPSTASPHYLLFLSVST